MKRFFEYLALAVIAGVLGARPALAQSAPSTDEDAVSSDTPAAAGPGVVMRFVHDVGGDYVHYFSLDTAIWLGAGGLAAAAVHPADESLSRSAQDHNYTLPGGSVYGSQLFQAPVAVAVWVIGAAAGSGPVADTGRDLLRAQIAVFSWTYAIKYATDRTRPNGDPQSFPSGHASSSFATAMVLEEHYGWKIGLPAFLLATYTGVSRVAVNQHWASDVVFGAAVGLTSGRTVTLHLRDTRFSVAPLAAPGGGGVLVTVLGPS